MIAANHLALAVGEPDTLRLRTAGEATSIQARVWILDTRVAHRIGTQLVRKFGAACTSGIFSHNNHANLVVAIAAPANGSLGNLSNTKLNATGLSIT